MVQTWFLKECTKWIHKDQWRKTEAERRGDKMLANTNDQFHANHWGCRKLELLPRHLYPIKFDSSETENLNRPKLYKVCTSVTNTHTR